MRIIPRHEMFLRAYIANGWRGKDAYRQIYGNVRTADIQAAKLLAIPHVKRRYHQMMKKILNRAEVTEERILGKYEEAFNMALEQGKPGDMIAAATSQAKLVGMLRERIEHGAPGEFTHLDSIADVLEAIGQQAGPEIALKLSEAFGIVRQIDAQPVEDLTQLAEASTPTDAVN